MEALFSSPEFTSQMNGEQNNNQVIGRVSTDMNIEDSVAFRVRAKRGCATHPRSIAERVRRTRISDRIKKLQELVPNMDKQTNTADMLEEAVEYVKVLQRQIQELTEEQKGANAYLKKRNKVRIVVVGKYTELLDLYRSIHKLLLKHQWPLKLPRVSAKDEAISIWLLLSLSPRFVSTRAIIIIH